MAMRSTRGMVMAIIILLHSFVGVVSLPGVTIDCTNNSTFVCVCDLWGYVSHKLKSN